MRDPKVQSIHICGRDTLNDKLGDVTITIDVTDAMVTHLANLTSAMEAAAKRVLSPAIGVIIESNRTTNPRAREHDEAGRDNPTEATS